MKTCALVFFIIINLSCDGQLISYENMSELFSKFTVNNLTKQENETLHDVAEIIKLRDNFLWSKVAKEVLKTSKAKLYCLTCMVSTKVFIDLVNLNFSEKFLIYMTTNLCKLLSTYDQNVCHGLAVMNVPIFIHVIKHTPDVKAISICSMILQSSENTNFCHYVDPRFNWTVELPDDNYTQTKRHNMHTNDEPLVLVLISDIHLDPSYQPDGETRCGDPLCSRKGQERSQAFTSNNVDPDLIDKAIIFNGFTVELDLSKVLEIRNSISNTFMASPGKSAGHWGDYEYSDTPLWAFDDAVDRITETEKKIDMVYYVGDTISHAIWEYSYDLVKNMDRYVANKLKKSFRDVPIVVPVIGNHDTMPINQFAPSNVTGNLNTTWMYEYFTKSWKYFLANDARKSLKKHNGDFSILRNVQNNKLRIISLNNNVANKFNWWLIYDPLEPKKHLDWLVSELFKAELAGERVHILTHIPPGYDDLLYTWSREYNRIINRFSATIAAEFNGHTHTDEFKLFYNLSNPDQPTNVAWGCGGLSSYIEYNLNYKVVTLNSQTYELETMKTYVYNLTEANLSPNQRPRWYELYDFANSFNITDLSVQSLNKLVEDMAGDKKHLLDLYSLYRPKFSDFVMDKNYCNFECQLDNICQIVTTVLWETRKCKELKKLYFNTLHVTGEGN